MCHKDQISTAYPLNEGGYDIADDSKNIEQKEAQNRTVVFLCKKHKNYDQIIITR